jgi:hypothetical protein
MASSVRFSGRLYNERHTFQVASQRLSDNSKMALLEVAILYEESLWAMLEMGTQIWGTPDTPYYRRKKAMYQARKGLPETGPWIKSGELVNHIKSDITQDGNKRFRAWAGFEKGSHSSGYSIESLVERLDWDFPLIEPAWERIKPNAMNILSQIGTGIFR